MAKKTRKVIKSRGGRLLLTAFGLFCTVMGILGIFLPLLPTIPLLLLAAACFARSSEFFHNWLLDHPQLGPMIRGYLDGQGIPMKAKISAIVMIWATIPLTVIFFIPLFWVRIFLIAIALFITIYLLRLPVCEMGEE